MPPTSPAPILSAPSSSIAHSSRPRGTGNWPSAIQSLPAALLFPWSPTHHEWHEHKGFEIPIVSWLEGCLIAKLGGALDRMAHEFLRNDILTTLSHRAEILGPYKRHADGTGK